MSKTVPVYISKLVSVNTRLTADEYTDLLYIGKRLGLLSKKANLKGKVDHTATIRKMIELTKKELTEPTFKFPE